MGMSEADEVVAIGVEAAELATVVAAAALVACALSKCWAPRHFECQHST